MTKIELSQKIVNSIINLARVNYLTGYWDTKRGQITKEFWANKNYSFDEANDTLLEFAETELQSRFNCEQRAKYRAILDLSFKELLCKK